MVSCTQHRTHSPDCLTCWRTLITRSGVPGPVLVAATVTCLAVGAATVAAFGTWGLFPAIAVLYGLGGSTAQFALGVIRDRVNGEVPWPPSRRTWRRAAGSAAAYVAGAGAGLLTNASSGPLWACVTLLVVTGVVGAVVNPFGGPPADRAGSGQMVRPAQVDPQLTCPQVAGGCSPNRPAGAGRTRRPR